MSLEFAKKPLIGMLHLLPLPGSPSALALAQVRDRLLEDADALVSGGCHALMMENFGDAPFFPGAVPAHVVAAMTCMAADVARHHDVPLGINVLRNDGVSALGIAAAVGAAFIRVNVLTGARVTDQGVIQGIAHELLRERARLGATAIKILADVDVKHSAALAPRPLSDEIADTFGRGMADAVVVSGSGTGSGVDPAKLAAAKAAAGKRPVLLGSGVTTESLSELWRHADGFIVGTSLKKNGVSTGPVDKARVKAMAQVHGRLG
jgi:membrane complex biogenesis BtpA family protein